MMMRYPSVLASVATMCFVGVLVACVPYTAKDVEETCADPYPVDKDETVPSFDGIPLPCDVLKQAGSTCATAHSTVRVIVPNYGGSLYQLCKGSAKAGPNSCKGEIQDIKAIDGYADVASHEQFCGEDSCYITKIYDQSGNGNDLEPSPPGGAKPSPDNPAKAMALPVKLNGHKAYGVLIKPGMGYRTGCTSCTIQKGKGMAVGDEPQSMYMITSQ